MDENHLDGGNCYYYEVAFKREIKKEISNKHCKNIRKEYSSNFLMIYEDKLFVKTSFPLILKQHLQLFIFIF